MNLDERYQAISNLAYDLWLSRGQPIGSPEVDWEQAEQLLGRDNEIMDAGSIDVLSFTADLSGDLDSINSRTSDDLDDDEPTQVSGVFAEKDIQNSTSPSPKIPSEEQRADRSNDRSKKNRSTIASESGKR